MKNWKINTAFVLCGAFMFQLVFFNVFTQISVTPEHALLSLKSNFLSQKAQKTQFEVAVNLEAVEYSLAETCEEEDSHASGGQTAIHILYSPLVHRSSTKLTSILPSDQYYSHFSSCRYLSLQVLRT